MLRVILLCTTAVTTLLAANAAVAAPIAHDPFLVSAGGSATEYDLTLPNQWNVGTIQGQGPQMTGFDGTTVWAGTSNYVSNASALTYSNGGTLVTSGGSVRHGDGGASTTTTEHRALTTGVGPGLSTIYASSLIRYDTPVGNGEYTGMGIASSDSSRDLIWGGRGTGTTTMKHGVGVKSGIGNSPGTIFGSDFGADAVNAHLYVLKVEMNAGAGNAERISVYMNPDLSLGEGGNTPLLNQLEAEAFTDSSEIDHFVFWSWRAGGSGTHYDELRLGTTWESVAPVVADPMVPEPATLGLLALAACGLGGYVRRRRKA